jgi:hypothetical protein
MENRMGRLVWKGWSTSWDQIAVPVTIAINPMPKGAKKMSVDVKKKSDKITPPINQKDRA